MISQMSAMNFSVKTSFEDIKLIVSHQIVETDASLQEMSINLQAGMNETENTVKEIRLEVRQMSEDSLSKINEVGGSIKAQAKADLTSAKNDFISRLNSENSRVNYQLKSLERKQESLEDEFEDDINDLERRISSEEERKVAFSARLSIYRSYYRKEETIVFDDVRYSYGGGYDSSTGIFTAPKSGTYLFTFTVESFSSGSAYIYLKVRGYLKTSVVAYKGLKTGGNAGIEHLWKGDKAWIETSSVDDRHYITRWRTTFNGILID